MGLYIWKQYHRMHFKYFCFNYQWNMDINDSNVNTLHIMQVYTYLFQHIYICYFGGNQKRSGVTHIYWTINPLVTLCSVSINRLALQQDSKLRNTYACSLHALPLRRILQKSIFVFCVLPIVILTTEPSVNTFSW